MAFLPQKFTIATMVSGSTFTPSLELPGAYLYVYLEVPTMSAGLSVGSTPIFVQGSSDGTTFRRMTNPDNTANTQVLGVTDMVVASSVSQRIVALPGFGARYIRLEVSGTATGANAAAPIFNVICVSNQ